MNDHNISFGKIARTILYRDDSGSIEFVFDVKPSKNPATGKWVLVLEPAHYAAGGSQLSSERAKLALARVAEYMAGIGYEVDIFRGGAT